MKNSSRPLTIFVIAYNQENFVADAVQSALGQDAANLEVILSDDASTDRTFSIMSALASAYDGPHRIVLNQNPTNLGIVPHVNRIMEIATGDLILALAGDDIAHNDRVMTTYAIWEACGRPHLIFFSTEAFDEAGPRPSQFRLDEATLRPSGMIASPGATVLAPAAAWRREIFEVFGPLPQSAKSEEKSIAFRAALLGNVVFVNKPLVDYRIHQGNISVIHESQRTRERILGARRRTLEWHLGRIAGFREDLEIARTSGYLVEAEYEDLCYTIAENEKLLREKLQLYEGHLGRKIRAARRRATRAMQSKNGALKKAKAFAERLTIDLFW